MARAPELFCQRMSGLLSPLKSPEPTIFQEVATDGRKMLLNAVHEPDGASAGAILPENVCLAVTVEIAFHGSRC